MSVYRQKWDNKMCACVSGFDDKRVENERNETQARARTHAHTHTYIHTQIRKYQLTNLMDQNYFVGPDKMRNSRKPLHFCVFQGVAFYIIISILMVYTNDFWLLDFEARFPFDSIVYSIVYSTISR